MPFLYIHSLSQPLALTSLYCTVSLLRTGNYGPVPTTQTTLNKPVNDIQTDQSPGEPGKSQVEGRCSMPLNLLVRSVTSPAPRLFSAPGSPGHRPTPSLPISTLPTAVPFLAPSQYLGSSPPSSSPEDSSLVQLPSLPPSSCSRLTTLFRAALPRSAPHPVLPAPILLGRASPVAAAARSAASAARSRAAWAMAGSDEGSTPGIEHWRVGAGRPAPPSAQQAVPPSSLAGHSFLLDKRQSLFGTRPSLAASLWGQALSLATSPSASWMRFPHWLACLTPAQVCAEFTQHPGPGPSSRRLMTEEELKL